MTKSTFCTQLTNNDRYVYGKLQACCWITRSADLTNPIEVDKYRKWMADIKSWVPECNYCRKCEALGLTSPRLQSFERKLPDEDSIVAEFQIDRLCNGACLICGPWNSTTWEKYNPSPHFEIKNINTRAKNDATKHLRQVIDNLDFKKVVSLNFLGGEPLLSDTHLIIIRELEKYKDLKDVSLTYITNGSQLPSDEIIEIWKKFKIVVLNLSIDGTGEHFNYLRWPLQWHQVERNLRYLMDANIPNLKFTCSYTITPFNIYYHDEYVKWANVFFTNLYMLTNDTNLFFAKPFAASGVMNSRSIPVKLQQAVRLKYSNFQSFDRNQGHTIDKCLSPFNEQEYKKFMEYVTQQDEKRKNNWRHVFPEISEYFK